MWIQMADSTQDLVVHPSLTACTVCHYTEGTYYCSVRSLVTAVCSGTFWLPNVICKGLVHLYGSVASVCVHDFVCVCVCSPCSTVAVLLRAFFSRLSSAEPASARTRLSPCEEMEGVRVNSLNWGMCDACRQRR